MSGRLSGHLGGRISGILSPTNLPTKSSPKGKLGVVGENKGGADFFNSDESMEEIPPEHEVQPMPQVVSFG
jgi:hypothetical protein